MATVIENRVVRSNSKAHQIGSDREAIRIAQELRESFAAKAGQRDERRILPVTEVEAFSGSGLWAITVPRAYGGAEVSAATLAEVVALVSEGDASIGQIPQNHYFMVENFTSACTQPKSSFDWLLKQWIPFGQIQILTPWRRPQWQ